MYEDLGSLFFDSAVALSRQLLRIKDDCYSVVGLSTEFLEFLGLSE